MTDYVPHAYQSAAIEFVKATPRSALFLDMGLGKTSVSLSAIRDLVAEGRAVRVLVIAPKRVAEHTWTDEAEKWAHTNGIAFSKILGSERERIAALERPAHVYLINRENVKWLVEHLSPVWPFDFLIIDESSSFKDQSSQRFRALRKVARKSARVLLLTGTPTPNNYLELWSQFYLLDPEILGRTFGGYRDAYFSPDRRSRDRVFTWKLDEGAREIIEARIAPFTMSLRASDYLDLPPRIDNVVRVRLSPMAKRLYDKLEADSVLELAADGLVTAANAAALTQKLAQASNGAIYTEDGGYRTLHSDKLEALAEILDTASGPVLVAYMFRHDRDRILERFPNAVPIERNGAMRDWNAGTLPILLAHPASAGHGLNLQAGGSTIVWFGLTWSNELHLQFNARLHRQGQDRPVVVNYLVGDGTIDEEILEALGNKHSAQEALLNALRRRIESATKRKAA